MFFEKILVPCLISSAIGLASPTIGHGIKKRADIDSFITTEGAIAYKGTLANIGPNGTGAPGASAGIVVASPSKTDPDCKFTPISHRIHESRSDLAMLQTFIHGPVILP